MWFVIAGCRIVAIVDTKAEGMERIRSLPPWSDRTSVSANGAAGGRRSLGRGRTPTRGCSCARAHEQPSPLRFVSPPLWLLMLC